MMDRYLNSAIKVVWHSATYEKRKLKAQLRKKFPALSSDDATVLVEECRSIHETIHAIASKSFGGEALSETEREYLDSLPLDEELKSELWQGAMFAQFR
jgi:hypothetical protein